MILNLYYKQEMDLVDPNTFNTPLRPAPGRRVLGSTNLEKHLNPVDP